MNLLTINTYDKDDYVDRWIDQCHSLDRSIWKFQVVKNGPSNIEWHNNEWKTIRCENPSIAPATLGYRAALSAAQIPSNVNTIVSVHAKTYLPDLSLLKKISNLEGFDVLLIDGWWPFSDHGGECLLAFAVNAKIWPSLIKKINSFPETLWNEVVMGRAIKELQLSTKKLSSESAMTTQDSSSYWIRNIDNSNLDLYCCEPSNGNMGFGHYAKPGGYHPIIVDSSGVVRRIK